AEFADLEEVWKAEKAVAQSEAHIKEELERMRAELEKARRASDLGRMAELQYGKIPELERRLEQAVKAEREGQTKLLRNKVTDEEVAEVVSKWTGIPVAKMLEGEKDKLLRMEQHLEARVVGQHEAVTTVSNAIRRARGAFRSESAERLVPILGSHGRRQDRAHEGARVVPVRHRGGHGPHRHVGVHGEAFGRALDRCAAGLRRLRRGRVSDRGRAPQAVFGGVARRGRESAPRRLQRAATSARRWSLDGRARPHRRLPQHRDRH